MIQVSENFFEKPSIAPWHWPKSAGLHGCFEEKLNQSQMEINGILSTFSLVSCIHNDMQNAEIKRLDAIIQGNRGQGNVEEEGEDEEEIALGSTSYASGAGPSWKPLRFLLQFFLISILDQSSSSVSFLLFLSLFSLYPYFHFLWFPYLLFLSSSAWNIAAYMIYGVVLYCCSFLLFAIIADCRYLLLLFTTVIVCLCLLLPFIATINLRIFEIELLHVGSSSSAIYLGYVFLGQEVISREVLVDEGHRQVVELEQAAIWRFLWWLAAILIEVLDHSNGVSVLKAIVFIREHKPIFPQERAHIQKNSPHCYAMLYSLCYVCLADDALRKLQKLNGDSKTMVKELEDLGNECSCIEHALGIMEENKTQKTLLERVSYISLTGAERNSIRYCGGYRGMRLSMVWMVSHQNCHHQNLSHHHILLQRGAELQSSIICLKRRSKINEKMKALQNLIPNYNKIGCIRYVLWPECFYG
ncbi:hypothetical protein RIF29_33913 [Crotalaria pallida]|uniref:Uncharacterized protein n=1 Tax=Crotalaria pallida TaxID=3830 RepID=A0AAN9E8D0_CROPI